MIAELASRRIRELLEEYPYAADFFVSVGLKEVAPSGTVAQMVSELPEGFLQDCGLNREQILDHFADFMEKMEELKAKPEQRLRALTILGGHDKSGSPEECSLTLQPGEIICIVGPTGSGKSRLLADIECLAQADTPTGRRILLDGKEPETARRFTLEYKLVAQLSQNMNFVVDLTVGEFVTMHAESRMLPNVGEMVDAVIECANDLAGEQFTREVSITQLSGGQSRALMIADTAILGASPIVLIDEIENAGVDRKKALELLISKEKIVLMSTHDPILALMGHKRIVIKNGGIQQIIETGGTERANLCFLEKIDRKLMELRNSLRTGGTVDMDIRQYFQLG